jgi:FAD/FMN-containing dehydrogenase
MVQRSIAVPDGAAVVRLRRRFHGQVLLPDQDGYHTARQVWNAMVDRRPAVIARCTSPSDVAAAVRLGRALGLELGVRGGGHSVLGLSVPDGGLMIDLTPMGSVRVDPERRRAQVAGGALLGALDRATQPYGLATTAGNVSHTGVGGLTLGGGMGWLARRFGLACDNVTRFELVSADGELLHASEQENPELFWGRLRGGGGNFGVVTEFEFALHQVGTPALLVDRFYALEDALGVLRRWRELLAAAPRQATLTAWVGTGGPWPFLAPVLWGRPLASVGYVWVGDPDQGRALLAALREGTPPLAERVQELSYLQLQTMDDQRQRPGLLRRYWKGHYLRDLDDAAIAAFLSRGDRGDGDPALLPSGSLQSYGGAIAEVRGRRVGVRPPGCAGGVRGRGGLVRPGRGPGADGGGAALWRRGGAVCQRRVRQRPHRRGPGGHPPRLRPRHAGTAGGAEGPLRPRQPLPPQPQHPAHGPPRPSGPRAWVSSRHGTGAPRKEEPMSNLLVVTSRRSTGPCGRRAGPTRTWRWDRDAVSSTTSAHGQAPTPRQRDDHHRRAGRHLPADRTDGGHEHRG